MPRSATICPEFSRVCDIAGLGLEEVRRDIEANENERAALARRFDLLRLDLLRAELRVQRLPGGLVRVTGRLEAEVVQACVVSMAPVPARIEQEFAASYDADAGPGQRVVVVPVEGEDPPEPIDGEAIDLGELVAQQFALQLDSYPRADGISLADVLPAEEPEASAAPGPFDALAALKGRPG